VSGIDGASWNNKRLHGVAFTLQVRNTVVELHRDESSNVLTNDPSGPGFLYNPEHFRPERTVVILASSLPGLGKWLAWKPACKQSCSPVFFSVELSDVIVETRIAVSNPHVEYFSSLLIPAFKPSALPSRASGVGHSFESLFKDRLRIRFDLHESYCLESRPLCGKGEAADAGK
jgi:hypothetical protein